MYYQQGKTPIHPYPTLIQFLISSYPHAYHSTSPLPPHTPLPVTPFDHLADDYIRQQRLQDDGCTFWILGTVLLWARDSPQRITHIDVFWLQVTCSVHCERHVIFDTLLCISAKLCSDISLSVIFDPNYPSHFPCTLHFLIYNVLSQYTILLQIPLHYITLMSPTDSGLINFLS